MAKKKGLSMILSIISFPAVVKAHFKACLTRERLEFPFLNDPNTCCSVAVEPQGSSRLQDFKMLPQSLTDGGLSCETLHHADKELAGRSEIL